jgi:hypothetical protein
MIISEEAGYSKPENVYLGEKERLTCRGVSSIEK